MKKRTSLVLCRGLAVVLAHDAVGVMTSPALAFVTAVTINPDGSVAQPGGPEATVSGTQTRTTG